MVWVRGKITNSGDRAIERRRVKLLRVEEKPTAVENGFFYRQGAIRKPLTISSQQYLVFDIAGGQGSRLTLLAYIGPNQLSQDLGHTCKLMMAIYSDNVRTRMKTVAIDSS
jgi:hypothetical protein